MLCVGLILGAVPAAAQGKSGLRSVNACALLTQAELEAALARKVQPRAVPPATPATPGVSVCMCATPDGRRTLSVSTYAPEAFKRTQTRTLPGYFDSLKTSNANNAGRPAQVLPGVARRAAFFPSPNGVGGTILIERADCVAVINVTGLSKEESAAVAKVAGN